MVAQKIFRCKKCGDGLREDDIHRDENRLSGIVRFFHLVDGIEPRSVYCGPVRKKGVPTEAQLQVQVLIPENNLGIEPGTSNVVELLREHHRSPTAVLFIADMLEM